MAMSLIHSTNISQTLFNWFVEKISHLGLNAIEQNQNFDAKNIRY